MQAFFWEAQAGSGQADKAYDIFAAAFAEAADRGTYLGLPCDKSSVTSRFQGLVGMVGEDAALEIITKEPVLLTRSIDLLKGSYEYLVDKETPENPGEALDIVKKNPKVLTISALEFERTKTTLDTLSGSAAAIDLLRPLGPWGITVALFGGFILLLVVVRPILYGVGGGQSIVSVVTSPLAGLSAGLPNFREVLEANGVSPAALVGAFAVYNALKAIASKYGIIDGKEPRPEQA